MKSALALPIPAAYSLDSYIQTVNRYPMLSLEEEQAYARAWHERMLDVARDYAGRGVRTLAINSNDAGRYPADSFEAMAERVSSEGGWPHPFLHDADQSVARAWGAEKTPHLFVLDGDLRLRYAGAPDADYDDPDQNAAGLREALDAVLAGETPDPAQTTAVGCGVKWKG